MRTPAAAIPATSPTSHSAPVSPSRTTSESPPARLATTGTPQASASSAERPNDSLALGSRNRSAPASSGATASSLPRKCTERCTSSVRASCSASTRSGPSPTMNSTLGTSALMRANVWTTSRTRFTGRMFDTCMITRRPRGTSHARAGGCAARS
jgi:hypothetical protein